MSHDGIAGSDVQLIEVTCVFEKFSTDQFWYSSGRRHRKLRFKRHFVKVPSELCFWPWLKLYITKFTIHTIYIPFIIFVKLCSVKVVLTILEGEKIKWREKRLKGAYRSLQKLYR